VAGNLAKPDTTPASLLEPFFYSASEEFLWLEHALGLEQTEIIWNAKRQVRTKKQDKELNTQLANIPDSADYLEVLQSRAKARSLVIHLMRQEMAQDKLPSRRRGESDAQFAKRMKVEYAKCRQQVALQTAKMTGNEEDRVTAYEIKRALQERDGDFLEKLIEALKLKKRPKAIDWEKIESTVARSKGKVSIVPRFLVDNWCGAPSQASYAMWFRLLKTDEYQGADGATLFDKTKPFYFLPPLCFLNENMRARFVADFLKRDQSDADMRAHAITNWVTKLGLKTASKPTITRINVVGIQDKKKLIKLVVVT